jgi:gas vesicle protein
MKQPSTQPKKKSHFKAGMLAGAVFGLAAGIFMSSKQGKLLGKDLQRKTKEIQKRLHKELSSAKNITESSYSESIDKVLAYYTKSRQIAKTEVPALRRYLLSKWKVIKQEMKSVK